MEAAATTKNHKKCMNDFVLYEFITGLNNTKNKEKITSNPVVQNFPTNLLRKKILNYLYLATF